MVSNSQEMQTQIREVWADNLDAELDILRELVDRYPYVSMVNSIDVFDIQTDGFRILNSLVL